MRTLYTALLVRSKGTQMLAPREQRAPVLKETEAFALGQYTDFVAASARALSTRTPPHLFPGDDHEVLLRIPLGDCSRNGRVARHRTIEFQGAMGTVIGNDPTYGQMCSGPMGPGPCAAVKSQGTKYMSGVATSEGGGSSNPE